jgi:preprotein translocase subunit YajC
MESLGMMLPLILMFLILYFLILRPQQKQQKKHAEMLKSLQKGDKIVTVGGLHGKVTAVNPEKPTMKIKISDGTEVIIDKNAVARKEEK